MNTHNFPFINFKMRHKQICQCVFFSFCVFFLPLSFKLYSYSCDSFSCRPQDTFLQLVAPLSPCCSAGGRPRTAPPTASPKHSAQTQEDTRKNSRTRSTHARTHSTHSTHSTHLAEQKQLLHQLSLVKH